MNYIEINKKAWNLKTDIHVNSDFYKQEEFLAGKNTLQPIELDLLGDVQGKKILHLQCHFGQDTLSLARMGAQVTGIDFSEKAIDVARETAQQLELDANFICCNLYDLKDHVQEKFDIVFTSYGTIGWLDNLPSWGHIVSHFLKPGASFIMVDFHPVVWMYSNDFSHVQYSYFQDEPIVEEMEGTYADREAKVTYQTVGFNHGLAEIMKVLLDQGLSLKHFEEFNYSPYNCLDQMEQIEVGQFIVKPFGNKIPLVYALVFQA